MEIRRLTSDDVGQLGPLSAEAFAAYPPGAAPEPRPLPAWRSTVGAVEDGRVVGKASGNHVASWWHGAVVPTCGVAGVSVAVEHRGRGLLADMLQAVLEEAHAHGEPISTLYPTAAGIYRSLGWELFASYDTVEVPTASLTRIRPPAGVRTRRATVEDVPALHELWTAWARHQNGPLTRDGAAFEETPEEALGEHHGVTLAMDQDDRVLGFASWTRTGGYAGEGVIEVTDLLAVSGEAYCGLWARLGTFEAVAPVVRLRTSGDDPARLVLPTSTWRVVARQPCSLRVDDPAAALTAAAPTVPGMTTSVAFSVRGDRLGRSDGDYRLTVGEEGSVCERDSSADGSMTFTPQGLSLAFAGVQSCANLRMLGHLVGPREHDRVLDAVLGGRPAHVRDYY